MGATMTWNGRKLMSYTTDDLEITYKYDADGLRTQKVVNGVEYNYYYVDGQLMYEGNDTYDYFYRYDQDGRLGLVIKRRLSDDYKWYFYPVTNSRGDIMELHNGPGQVTARYNYDAWGKLISITDANGNALADGSFAHLISARYRGYYYDSETGLYYLQSRYYDPETGRFINADDAMVIKSSSTKDSLSKNLYSYCKNSVVCLKDDNGKRATSSIMSKAIQLVVAMCVFEDYYDRIDIQLDSERVPDGSRAKKVKNTKGYIVVIFDDGLGKFIYENFNTAKEQKEACDMLALIAREKFKLEFAADYNNKKKNKKYKSGHQKEREFLFSEKCVAKEIYQHFKGYAWSKGFKGISIPTHMYIWGIKDYLGYSTTEPSRFWKLSRNKIYGATKNADIAEADVWYNNGKDYKKTSEAYWYDYFGGIADCYKWTEFDPYYNPETDSRSKKNIEHKNKWLELKLE